MILLLVCLVKKLIPIVTELFIRGTKVNISLVFITQSYFVEPKNIRLNSTHCPIMKIPNKQELQQIAFNRSSDIDFKRFMNLYKKCSANPYCFLVIDATLASGNPLRFRKNFLERIQKLIMTIDDKIRDETLQYDINKEATKILALSSGKNYKHEYLTGEEILPPDQRRGIEPAKFTYSPLGKALEKQIKTIEDHGKQLVESNEIAKKDFNIDRDSVPLEEPKKYLMNLLKKNLGNFRI